MVSFHTYVNVGSVDDPGGETGLAHMFEHMAFKGTPTIGTKNWPAEKAALDAVEVVYDRLDAERNKGPRADPKKIAAIQAELEAAIEKADSYVEPNEYDRVVESNGGVDMNAGTGEDSTNYFYSFPVEPHRAVVPAGIGALLSIRCSASSTRNATWCAKSAACASNRARRASWWRRYAGDRLRGASLSQHARRLGQRHRTLPPPRRREILQAILRAGQHDASASPAT